MLLSGEICLTGDRNHPLRSGYKFILALHQRHRMDASKQMTNDSASGGNTTGKYAEVSRRHSSQTPIVMVGTG